MKKIIVSSLLAASFMFGANVDLDNLTQINNEQLKQSIWFLDGDKPFDVSVISDQDMKRFFVSLLVTKPFVAKVIINNFQAKNCKNDLTFMNTISLQEIKDFVNSKQYATLLDYGYSNPIYYENIKNNVKYLMCGTESFTPDIASIKSQTKESTRGIMK